jgi:hypothetical protein
MKTMKKAIRYFVKGLVVITYIFFVVTLLVIVAGGLYEYGRWIWRLW